MPTDILSDDNGLIFENGDIKIADSTNQHQQDLLLAAPGEYKQHPLVGVDIYNYIDDDVNVDELEIAIRNQFEADGMQIRDIKIEENGEIKIDSYYSR